MRRILIIAAFLLLPGICLVAQQYPVQVTPQLVPPYSLQVSDYYSAIGSPKLNLLLLLRDFNKPSLQVRLRMSITSQSVAIVTREDVSFTAIEILSGQPKYIQPADLTEYFNSNNLTFSGITQSQYEQTGKLPEGFYTFCFELVDVVTGQTVSNKGCTFAWLTLSEPPLLNLPRKAEALIPVIEPAAQNVSFQWTPRHTASPTAYTIDYNFKLVELPLGTTTPEADFASYPAIYEESTAITTILYDGIGAKPRLKPGYTYAWQVQAKAKSGTQDVAMFRNNGYSEIFWFVYQNNCPVPTSINSTAQGQRVNITWGGDVQHLDYKVEYRKANTAGAEWFELGNTTPNVSITDLDPSTTYEYRIGAACETGKYIFSSLHQFSTNSATATTVPQCGFDPNPAPTTEPLLQQMNVGDVIKAGDFDVVITKVSGNSSFSGAGYVVVPWLANVKVGVSFENIGVGTDMKLKVGEIVTLYDPESGLIADVDAVVDEIKDVINSLTDNIKNLIQVLKSSDVVNDPQKIVNYAYDIISSTTNEIPEQVLKDIVDKTKQLDAAKDALINAGTDIERQQAEEKIQAAADNLANAWNNFLQVYTNILKEAVKKYYNEKKPQEATIIANYQNLLASVNQNNTASVTNDDIIIHEIITTELVSNESLDPAIKTLINDFASAEKAYIMYQFAKILTEEGDSGGLLDKFVEKAKLLTVDITNEIKLGLEKNNSKDVIIENVKVEIVHAFEKIIEDIIK